MPLFLIVCLTPVLSFLFGRLFHTRFLRDLALFVASVRNIESETYGEYRQERDGYYREIPEIADLGISLFLLCIYNRKIIEIYYIVV